MSLSEYIKENPWFLLTHTPGLLLTSFNLHPVALPYAMILLHAPQIQICWLCFIANCERKQLDMISTKRPSENAAVFQVWENRLHQGHPGQDNQQVQR